MSNFANNNGMNTADAAANSNANNQQEEQKPSFIKEHWFFCIALPVFGILVFGLMWGIQSCGSSTSALCKTLHAIGSGLSAIVSPLVAAWRTLVMFFAIILGGMGLLGAMKLVSKLGGKDASNEAEAEALMREKGPNDDDIAEVVVKVDAENKPVLDANGDPVMGILDANGKFHDVIPPKWARNQYNQEALDNQAENKPAGPSFESDQLGNMRNTGEAAGLDDNDDVANAEGEAMKFDGGGVDAVKLGNGVVGGGGGGKSVVNSGNGGSGVVAAAAAI